MEHGVRAPHGPLASRRRREAEASRYRGVVFQAEEFHHDETLPSCRRRRAVNAARISVALAERAEAVCRHYLPHGRRQGRLWTPPWMQALL